MRQWNGGWRNYTGYSFRTEDYGHSNRIGLTVHQASTSGAEYFPVQNVGFGISYVLPVVLSLVKAKPGELVIIENPGGTSSSGWSA